jgi:hypothetical protein
VPSRPSNPLAPTTGDRGGSVLQHDPTVAEENKPEETRLVAGKSPHLSPRHDKPISIRILDMCLTLKGGEPVLPQGMN